MKKLAWIFLLRAVPCLAQATSGTAHGRFWEILSSTSIFITAVSTVVIAVVYYLQWKALRATVEESRNAASAARDSADAAKQAFLSTHRPRIATRFMSVEGIGTFELSGRFRVFNCGETKAILQRYYSEVLIAPLLPAVPSSQPDGEDFLDEELRPGQSKEASLPTGGVRTLTVHERNALQNRIEDIKKHGKDTETDPPNLFVLGWITYIDEGKVLRTVGFCKKYNFATHRFEREFDEDYEYGDHR